VTPEPNASWQLHGQADRPDSCVRAGPDRTGPARAPSTVNYLGSSLGSTLRDDSAGGTDLCRRRPGRDRQVRRTRRSASNNSAASGPAADMDDRRPLDVVEQALDQVTCQDQVLQALLIQDPDRVAAEVVSDPQPGNVHLVLATTAGPQSARSPRRRRPCPGFQTANDLHRVAHGSNDVSPTPQPARAVLSSVCRTCTRGVPVQSERVRAAMRVRTPPVSGASPRFT
jgi:hypothetical protein